VNPDDPLLQLQPSDRLLLQEVQRRAVNFFLEKAHPATGLINDRAHNFKDDNFTVASIAATGYGLAALPIGVANQWLTRVEAARRARTTLRFLTTMPHERGWMCRFVDKSNGERMWGSEYSSIDTAILLCGAIACAQFFANDPSANDIFHYCDQLYRRIDWWWMLTNDRAQPQKQVLSHGWTPESGFLAYNYDSYSEAILLTLLGLGAPVRPLPEQSWDAIRRTKQIYGGLELLKAGPIFIHQMPAGFFHLGNKRDRLGYDYWVSSANAMKMHRQYCIDHAGSRQTYANGYWGLNASDGPFGYTAYGAPDGPEDGTVSPTGAISSITFTPDAATAIARSLHEKLGTLMWGNYGFGNAFNIDHNWHDPEVIGIDLGMVVVAIENYRTGLVWSLMNSHYAIGPALRAAGFRATVEVEPRPLQRTGGASEPPSIAEFSSE
jgi:hypothetical protein